ncbi:MAG: hypothetical protein AAF737_09930, partial [Pseudomonadota bacterium]
MGSTCAFAGFARWNEAAGLRYSLTGQDLRAGPRRLEGQLEEDAQQAGDAAATGENTLADSVSLAGEVMNDIDAVNVLSTQLQDIVRGAIAIAPQIIVAIIVLLLTGALAGAARWIIRRVTSRSKMRRSLKELFELLATIAVWTLGLMIAAVIVFPNL